MGWATVLLLVQWWGRGIGGGVFHPEQACLACLPGPQADDSPRGVVPDAVDEQVVEGPAKEKLVGFQAGQGLVRQVQRQGETLRQTAVEKIRGGLAQEGGQVQLGFPKGLHLAVQTHGEVQVVDQVPDGLALPADDGGLVPAGRGQGGVGLQLSRIAHDHTQGGTDVVGDAVNPVRPGFIPGLLVLPENLLLLVMEQVNLKKIIGISMMTLQING